MEEIRLVCDSKITIINTKTGYIYKDEEEWKCKSCIPKEVFAIQGNGVFKKRCYIHFTAILKC